MAALTGLALAGLGISAAAGIGNVVANMSANDRAAAAQDQNLQNWLKIQIPDPNEQKLALQQFVQQGTITPKLQTAINQNPTQFNNISVSAQNKAAQSKALSSLQQIGDQGGLRLQDKAALQQAMLQNQAQEKGARDAIISNMAQRGLGGSGFSLAAQLQAQQSGADRNAQNSLNVASQAQDRALQSLMGAGQLATQYRNQDYQQAAQTAEAQDAINRFNAQNQQSVQAQNVAAQNAAQQYNLNLKQQIANQNTELANQQQQYNKGLLQQQFQNQAAVAQGEGGIYGQQAGLAQQQGQILGNAFSNIGNAATGALGSIANYQNQQNNFANQNSVLDKQQNILDQLKKMNQSGQYGQSGSSGSSSTFA